MIIVLVANTVVPLVQQLLNLLRVNGGRFRRRRGLLRRRLRADEVSQGLDTSRSPSTNARVRGYFREFVDSATALIPFWSAIAIKQFSSCGDIAHINRNRMVHASKTYEKHALGGGLSNNSLRKKASPCWLSAPIPRRDYATRSSAMNPKTGILISHC